MTERAPREAGDIPPDRRSEENPQGADPDTGDTNPERQGPGGAPGPSDAPDPDAEEGPSGPPPESIPGDQGQVPNPKR
jgi:hypothetical protein